MSAAAEPAVAAAPAAGRAPARAWIVFTTVLMWVVFLQAVTAGRIFAGDEWARDVHRSAAGLLFLAGGRHVRREAESTPRWTQLRTTTCSAPC